MQGTTYLREAPGKMIFDQLKVSDLLCWSDTLKKNYQYLPLAQMWTYEPLDCVLQVVNIVSDNLNSVIHLDCVVSCGLHEVLSVDLNDYDTCEQLIGAEMFRYATMEEATSRCATDTVTIKESYNLKEDVNYVFELLQSDEFPVRQRRGA